MKHSVIYARVACEQVDVQEDLLKSQVKNLKKFAKRNNLKVKQVFADYGSGLNQNRAAFSHLLEEVSRGRVKNILCHDLTRITRSYCDWAEIEQLLKREGVRIITL